MTTYRSRLGAAVSVDTDRLLLAGSGHLLEAAFGQKPSFTEGGFLPIADT